jgi:hypothetical protein
MCIPFITRVQTLSSQEYVRACLAMFGGEILACNNDIFLKTSSWSSQDTSWGQMGGRIVVTLSDLERPSR